MKTFILLSAIVMMAYAVTTGYEASETHFNVNEINIVISSNNAWGDTGTLFVATLNDAIQPELNFCRGIKYSFEVTAADLTFYLDDGIGTNLGSGVANGNSPDSALTDAIFEPNNSGISLGETMNVTFTSSTPDLIFYSAYGTGVERYWGWRANVYDQGQGPCQIQAIADCYEDNTGTYSVQWSVTNFLGSTIEIPSGQNNAFTVNTPTPVHEVTPIVFAESNTAGDGCCDTGLVGADSVGNKPALFDSNSDGYTDFLFYQVSQFLADRGLAAISNGDGSFTRVGSGLGTTGGNSISNRLFSYTVANYTGNSDALDIFSVEDNTFGIDVDSFVGLRASQANEVIDWVSGFAVINSTNMGAFVGTVEAGDFNGDGHDDAAVVRPGALDIYYGDSNSNFVTSNVFTWTSTDATVAAVADLNADGSDDIAFAINDASGDLYIVTEDSPTQSTVNSGISSTPTDISILDYNNDGFNDVLVSYSGAGGLAVLYGPDFTTTDSLLSSGDDCLVFAAADLNADTYVDLVLRNSSGQFYLENNGDDTFTAYPFAGPDFDFLYVTNTNGPFADVVGVIYRLNTFVEIHTYSPDVLRADEPVAISFAPGSSLSFTTTGHTTGVPVSWSLVGPSSRSLATANDDSSIPQCCGNGVLQLLEACDDGDTVEEPCPYGLVSCSVCSETCTIVSGDPRVCGDGDIDSPDEDCDDGNAITEPCPYGDEDGCGDTCGSTCNTVESPTQYCGDSVIQAGQEDCDDGPLNTDACTYGETSCDYCDLMCLQISGTPIFCGDNSTQTSFGEECDDGANDNGDGCDEFCRNEVCGNGFVQSGEECDDGNVFTELCEYGNSEGCIVCDSSCTNATGVLTGYCGDGELQASFEECDGTDDCDVSCKKVLAEGLQLTEDVIIFGGIGLAVTAALTGILIVASKAGGNKNGDPEKVPSSPKA